MAKAPRSPKSLIKEEEARRKRFSTSRSPQKLPSVLGKIKKGIGKKVAK
jgi:hypothetical protein